MKRMELTWKCKAYPELTLDDFFGILYLRTEVFIIEQNCPYQDIDAKDKKAFHLFAMDEQGDVIAVTRILPPGVSYDEISIGRVAIKQSARGTGLGHTLMQKSLSFIENEFGSQPIRISAQDYLINYYEQHGFKQVSEMYLEDDIPHVEMLKD